MILSMSGQAWLFLGTAAAGFVIGFVYDIFRILRKTVPHRQIAVQIEDCLYWAAVSFMMFYFMLHSNYGEVRFFSIVGAALGMILYFYSLSPLVMAVSIAVIRFMQRVLLTAARIILTPIRLVAKILKPPGKWLYRKTRSMIRLVKRSGFKKLRLIRRNIFVILKKV